MPAPRIYAREFSFAGFQANNPSRPLPGLALDNELENVEQSLTETIAALNDIRRPDGQLRNGVVGRDALAPDLSTGVRPATLWQSAIQYQAQDTVSFGAAFYRCTIGHVSAPSFLTDLTAGRWELYADIGSVATDAQAARNEAVAAAATAVPAAAAATSASNNATTLYDLFDDRYLGEKETLPALDNDGNALVNGALVSLASATNPNLNGVYVRRNGAWAPVIGDMTNASTAYRYVATAGQATFSGADADGRVLAYVLGGVFVTVNGVTLSPNTYTASTGTSVVLASPLSAGDVVVVYAFAAFSVADTWTKAEADGRYQFAGVPSVGAELSDFTPAGNGAVVRTLRAKARERVDARDFGVVADGVTDDTAALQAAYDYACFTKNILYLPPGTIMVSQFVLGGPRPGDRVIDRRNTPPSTPAVGDRYLTGAAPTGAWSGQPNARAEWNGSTWTITAVSAGTYIGLTFNNSIELRTSTGWAPQQAFVGHRGCVVQGSATDTRGNAFRATVIKQLPGTLNADLILSLAGDAPHTCFRDVVIHGNDALQTTPNRGIHLEDDLVSAYPFGLLLYQSQVQYTRGEGIRIGRRRGWSHLIDVTTAFTGNLSGLSGHAIVVDSYDCILTNCHINSAGGYGIYAGNTSFLKISMTDAFLCGAGGMFVSSDCADIIFVGGALEFNSGRGMVVEPYTGLAGFRVRRKFVGTRFQGNSGFGNNAFADIEVQGGGDSALYLSGCDFAGALGGAAAAVKPSHAIIVGDTAVRVVTDGISIAPDSHFGTAGCNNWLSLVGYLAPNSGLRSNGPTGSVELWHGDAAAARFLAPSGATDGVALVGSTSGNPAVVPFGPAANINFILRPKGATSTLLIGSATQTGMTVAETGGAPAIGFLGASAVTRRSVNAAATDPATTQALVNSIRTALIQLGLVQ